MRREKAWVLVGVAAVMVGEAALGRMVTGLWIPSHAPWTPWLLLGREVLYLAIVLPVTFLLGLGQGRSLADYGFPVRYAFKSRFWEGAAWGLGSCAAIYAVLAAAGSYTVGSLAVAGPEAVGFAARWALAMLAVAIYEELYFRGLPLFTLSRGLGFWPAAVLLSLYFGGLHYLGKPNETPLDLVNVSLLGLFFCFTVRRTSDLWFAIGWHWSFNYGSLVVFGSPNTGNDGGKPLDGRLLEGVFTGPDWLTGGPPGAQASVVTLAVVAALFAAFHRRHRKPRYPASERRP